jgi:hypothetical protein
LPVLPEEFVKKKATKVEKSEDQDFGWAVLELMGHRRLGGKVSATTLAGAPVLRIDVPAPDGSDKWVTQFYAPHAMYALTPTTEEIARKLAKTAQPSPVYRFELATRDDVEALS